MAAECIFLSKTECFILPLFLSLEMKTNKPISFIKRRYIGGKIINQDASIFEIENIIMAKTDVFTSFLSRIGITTYSVKLELKKIDNEWTDILEDISISAIQGDSFSVWGQFYDTENDLQKAILASSNYNQLKKNLSIDEFSIANSLL